MVTTFEPNFKLITNLRSLARQNTHAIILVDDSGTGKSNSFMDELSRIGVILLVNNNNVGIASSLNVGISKAIELNADYILTLDDDSTLCEGYIESLFNSFYARPKSVACGLIENSNQDDKKFYSGITIKRNLITSGCIYPVSVFLDIGFFNEKYFIDLVDFEFCTRLRRNGYSLLQVQEAKMTHTIGKSKNFKFLGLEIIVYHHTPFRIYYQVRNVFLYIYTYLFDDPFYCGYLLLNIAKTFLKIVFFEKEKKSRLYFLFKGIIHGLFNRGGRLK